MLLQNNTLRSALLGAAGVTWYHLVNFISPSEPENPAKLGVIPASHTNTFILGGLTEWINEWMNGGLLHAWKEGRGTGSLVIPSRAVSSPGQGYSSRDTSAGRRWCLHLSEGEAKAATAEVEGSEMSPWHPEAFVKVYPLEKMLQYSPEQDEWPGLRKILNHLSSFWNISTSLSWKKAVLLQELCFLKASYSLHHMAVTFRSVGVGESPIPANKSHWSFSFLFSKWRFIILSTFTSLLAFLKLMNQLQSTFICGTGNCRPSPEEQEGYEASCSLQVCLSSELGGKKKICHT